jgi:hypothetical protein
MNDDQFNKDNSNQSQCDIINENDDLDEERLHFFDNINCSEITIEQEEQEEEKKGDEIANDLEEEEKMNEIINEDDDNDDNLEVVIPKQINVTDDLETSLKHDLNENKRSDENIQIQNENEKVNLINTKIIPNYFLPPEDLEKKMKKLYYNYREVTHFNYQYFKE